jgi:mannose/cellobiose epimerase-like protein (N-acyl-D-glucosamine 2-epimerase family)
MVKTNGDAADELLLTRYINPGHTIEDMWFILQEAKKRNMISTIDRALNLLKKLSI